MGTSNKYFTDVELERNLSHNLSGMLDPHFGSNINLADSNYYLPTKREVEELYAASELNNFKYDAESMDCDDYALLFKAWVTQTAYKDNRRRPPMALGMVWGKVPFAHALNIFINQDDKQIYLLEPQTGVIYKPKGNISDIWMIYI